MLAGYLRPTRGEVMVLGHAPTDTNALRARIGVLPQDALLPAADAALNGEPATVATIKVANVAIAPAGVGFHITGDILQNKKGTAPFGGEHFASQINVDNLGDFISCLSGSASVSEIDFSAAGGSSSPA